MVPSSWPLTSILPRVGGISPATNFSKVDFPAPDGPETNTNSPAEIRKLVSVSALMPRPYDLKTWLNSIMAGEIVPHRLLVFCCCGRLLTLILPVCHKSWVIWHGVVNNGIMPLQRPKKTGDIMRVKGFSLWQF